MRARILLLMLTLLLAACSASVDSPEQQVRQLIEAAVQAGEARSVDAISNLLHTDYIDQYGNNRKQLGRLLRAYFLRHKNIHLFTRIDSIEIPADNQASVSLHVAMAGTVIADANALEGLRARIYRFDLQLVKQDEWRLRHATWAPANSSVFK